MNTIIFILFFAAGVGCGAAIRALDRTPKDAIVSARRYRFLSQANSAYNRIDQYFHDNRDKLELLSLDFRDGGAFAYKVVVKYRRLDPDFRERF